MSRENSHRIEMFMLKEPPYPRETKGVRYLDQDRRPGFLANGEILL
jgi:hypothetical protein